MKSATFALLALIAGAAPALAQSRADRAACTPDVMRLCAAQIPNVAAITVCLRQQRPNLSAGCRTVMDQSDRPVRTVSNGR
ncbi:MULTISPECIES: hypothetical protein [unclassified Methylobacterium]|uniref:hypothetical protein n=1 Tax=unclassified Methylobacterium TaxID=2615210 RepID=UPI0011C1E133|nr:MULTISPECIES: hypothetical protein [unclassified Methylobacterium]QEE37654.1 hypothetical protein FVA80_00475 [Methylobacterium sp. WL1]TXN04823.1 hypothetical protein FV242_05550 [Methylobacterium sp. WL64]TXN56297.1 hypothetical protein FV241_16130 [Methylobacterium sp. WL2]